MTILVTAASRHGSTMEIAEVIGRVLRDRGLPVDVRPVETVTMVDGYSAVVLGSAVYMGRWLAPARRLADLEAVALAWRPVWLFSSGPIGIPPKPDKEPDEIAAIATTTKAREHRVFAGRLDKQKLSVTERAVALAVRAPAGDFRDWTAVEAWATSADALQSQSDRSAEPSGRG